jgi:hypothetical protein
MNAPTLLGLAETPVPKGLFGQLLFPFRRARLIAPDSGVK